MIILAIKYFYFLSPFSNLIFSFFYSFWVPFSSAFFHFWNFFFYSIILYWFKYLYCICIFFSLELLWVHYFYIFYHFYLTFFSWKDKYLLTYRHKFFFVFRWITGISPIFYSCMLFIICSHFFVSCFFYSLGLLIHKILCTFVPEQASTFKKFFDSCVTRFISKFIYFFLFLFHFLSLYRFFLYLLLKFLTFSDLLVLRFLKWIVHLISRLVFYCTLYSWKFFHIRRKIRHFLRAFEKFYNSYQLLPNRLAIALFYIYFYLLKKYIKICKFFSKKFGILRKLYFRNRFIFYVSCFEFFYNSILVNIIFDLNRNYLFYIYIIFLSCILLLLKMIIVFHFIYPDIFQDILGYIYPNISWYFSREIFYSCIFLHYLKYHFWNFYSYYSVLFINLCCYLGLVNPVNLNQPYFFWNVILDFLLLLWFFSYIFWKIYLFFRVKFR